MAVVLDNVCLSIGFERVLRSISLTLNLGEIYALCGPSGCGKTSLCQAVIGLRKISGGNLTRFPNAKIPGKDVGYMPQSLCLSDFLTGRETLRFYGCIHGLSCGEIKLKTCQLSGLLQLDKLLDRRMSSWSSGQQRRLSLAVSILHSPKLLILDEPTVGVDPVLRETIWAFLEVKSAQDKTAILITTHYLAEADRAHKVGFMRKGQMLMEGVPGQLKKLQQQTLDDVFFRLCQEKSEEKVVEHMITSPANNSSRSSSLELKTTAHLTALLGKNMINAKRHLGFLTFQAFLPILVVTLFYFSIGRPLIDIPLGLVNNNDPCSSLNAGCENLRNFSCLFSQALQNKFELSMHENCYEAGQEVRKGHTFGWVMIPKDFAASLLSIVSGDYSSTTSSIINVNMDNSNSIVSQEVRRKVVLAFEESIKEMLKQCGYDAHHFKVGAGITFSQLSFTPLSYGLSILPSLLVVVQHLFASSLTADQLVTEREGGLLQRQLANGVPMQAAIFCQVIIHLLVVIPQALLSLTALAILGLQVSIDLFAFLLVQGIAGMCFGLFMSVHCQTRDQVIQVGIASVLPTLVLSGTLWPREAMPELLQSFAMVMPVTATCQAASNLVLKGSASFVQYLLGLVIPLVWSGLFLLGSGLSLKSWLMYDGQ